MLLNHFKFICRQTVLLVARGGGIFIYQINCMVKCSVRSQTRSLKHILKLITQSSILCINLIFPTLRLFLAITWPYSSKPTSCRWVRVQSSQPCSSGNKFGFNRGSDSSAVDQLALKSRSISITRRIQSTTLTSTTQTQLIVNPVNAWIVLLQPIHAQNHIRCKVGQYTDMLFNHHRLLVNSTRNLQTKKRPGNAFYQTTVC